MGHPHLVVHIAPPDLVVLGYLCAFDGLLRTIRLLVRLTPIHTLHVAVPICACSVWATSASSRPSTVLHASRGRWMSVLIPGVCVQDDSPEVTPPMRSLSSSSSSDWSWLRIAAGVEGPPRGEDDMNGTWGGDGGRWNLGVFVWWIRRLDSGIGRSRSPGRNVR